MSQPIETYIAIAEKKSLKNKNKSAASQKKKIKSKKIVRKSRLRDNPEIASGNSWTLSSDGILELTLTVPPGKTQKIQMRDIFHSFLRGIWL